VAKLVERDSTGAVTEGWEVTAVIGISLLEGEGEGGTTNILEQIEQM